MKKWTVLMLIPALLVCSAAGLAASTENGWQLDENGNWTYWMDGHMATGWICDSNFGGEWFYLDPDSGIMHTGWLNDNGFWYYFHPSNGIMQTGWLLSNGAWYYLDPDNGAMCTGWITDSNGNRFFLDDDGVFRDDQQQWQYGN